MLYVASSFIFVAGMTEGFRRGLEDENELRDPQIQTMNNSLLLVRNFSVVGGFFFAAFTAFDKMFSLSSREVRAVATVGLVLAATCVLSLLVFRVISNIGRLLGTIAKKVDEQKEELDEREGELDILTVNVLEVRRMVGIKDSGFSEPSEDSPTFGTSPILQSPVVRQRRFSV